MGEASTTIVTAGGAKKPKHELRIICGMAGIRGGWCATQATSTPLLTPARIQRCRLREKTWGSYARCLGENYEGDRVVGAALWASMNGLYGQRALRKPRTLAAVRALQRAPSIRDKAATLRRTLFGDRPYLCARVRRVENAQRCRDGGSVRAPQVSCPPVKAGYVATRRLAETLRTASAAAGVADEPASRAWPCAGGPSAKAPLYSKFLRNGSLAAASASADVDVDLCSVARRARSSASRPPPSWGPPIAPGRRSSRTSASRAARTCGIVRAAAVAPAALEPEHAAGRRRRGSCARAAWRSGGDGDGSTPTVATTRRRA